MFLIILHEEILNHFNYLKKNNDTRTYYLKIFKVNN